MPQEVRDVPQHRQDRRRGTGAALFDAPLQQWAWKSLDWDAIGRLHDKGMIDNPASKRKSVALTEEGLQRAKALFEAMF
jgi:hypothetical protein